MSTTVDEELLAQARAVCGSATDAALLDEALHALVARHRSTELDASYQAYDDHPLAAAIPRLRRTLVAPCTTTVRGLASEVVLEPGEDPVPRRSAVNLDALGSVSVGALVERLGAISRDRMREMCAALEVAVDCLE